MMTLWRHVAALLVAALVLTVALPAAAKADAPRRFAHMVANGAYLHAGSMKNTVSDAQLVSGALKAAGFQIVPADPNLGIGPFRDALRRFRSNAVGAQVALIYYAGHGIEARGKNWLIPTDAILQQDADLDYEAIDLDLVLSATEGADMRVVILDACRNNPFGHSWHRTQRAVGQGLAPIDVDDVLVIYSAAPGQTASDGRGANSPFAEALNRRLPQAGLPIQLLGGMVRDDVLRATGQQQRPFISASITGTPFMLVPGASAPSPAAEALSAAASVAPPTDARSIEMMFWQSASTSEDASQLKAYLSRYPNGSFTDLAKARIASLERPTPTVATGPAKDRNLPAPAKLDPHAMELAYWNSVSGSGDIGQLSAYIDEYPSGQFVRLARAKIAALTRPAAPVTSSGGASANTAAPRPVNAAGPANGPAGTRQIAPSSGRFGGSDDYVCNNGPPSDPRTVEACKRLRGTPE